MVLAKLLQKGVECWWAHFVLPCFIPEECVCVSWFRIEGWLSAGLTWEDEDGLPGSPGRRSKDPETLCYAELVPHSGGTATGGDSVRRFSGWLKSYFPHLT